MTQSKHAQLGYALLSVQSISSVSQGGDPVLSQHGLQQTHEHRNATARISDDPKSMLRSEDSLTPTHTT